MKFGLIHYRAPGDTLEQFLDYAADTGFEAVELMPADVWPEGEDAPERRAETVRGFLDARGLVAGALGTGNDFVVLEPQRIQDQVERMERFGRLAAILGAGILRTEGGQRKDEVPADREAEAIGECLKRCVPFAERLDISLAVDNHGFVTNDPQILLGALDAADSPRIGANLDTANVHWAGNSRQVCCDFYDRVAPRVLHTHIKDCTGSAPESNYRGTVAGEGDVDLQHALQALRRVGYDGIYAAEWEGPGHEDGGVAYARCLDWMKRNIQPA